jgi:hypothetical protein
VKILVDLATGVDHIFKCGMRNSECGMKNLLSAAYTEEVSKRKGPDETTLLALSFPGLIPHSAYRIPH